MYSPTVLTKNLHKKSPKPSINIGNLFLASVTSKKQTNIMKIIKVSNFCIFAILFSGVQTDWRDISRDFQNVSEIKGQI